mgnify:CR=1 FL=1
MFVLERSTVIAICTGSSILVPLGFSAPGISGDPGAASAPRPAAAPLVPCDRRLENGARRERQHAVSRVCAQRRAAALSRSPRGRLGFWSACGHVYTMGPTALPSR